MTTIHTKHLKIQHIQKVNNTKVRKYCIYFLAFFPTHIVLTLSPQPVKEWGESFTNHINFSYKVSFLPPSLHLPPFLLPKELLASQEGLVSMVLVNSSVLCFYNLTAHVLLAKTLASLS
jgi:hypothetical protein